MMKVSAFSLAMVAGLATANPGLPTMEDGAYIEPDSMIGVEDEYNYMYINMATGEKIYTSEAILLGNRGLTSNPVWLATNNIPCAAFGQTGGSTGVFDSIGSGTAWETGAYYLNWGDIPADTVIDAVQVRYTTRHVDVLNDQGVPSGVVGLGSTWLWVEGDDGFNSCTTREPLVSITFFNLPGRTTVPAGTGYSVFVLTVDLADSGLSFEIGDTDGDPQGAAVHNAFANANGELDLDGNGLVDFGYAQRFYQPGTVDWDGDGVLDGDPAAAANCGNSLVAPRGTPVPIPDHPTFRWTVDPVAALPEGQGITDRFERYLDFNGPNYVYVGGYTYSGFSCDSDGNGVGGPYRSWAQFWHAMYGPSAPQVCRADMNSDGLLNFFDISTYIGLFNTQNPAADFFPVAGGDGVFNFFDLSTFLGEFNAGCP